MRAASSRSFLFITTPVGSLWVSVPTSRMMVIRPRQLLPQIVQGPPVPEQAEGFQQHLRRQGRGARIDHRHQGRRAARRVHLLQSDLRGQCHRPAGVVQPPLQQGRAGWSVFRAAMIAACVSALEDGNAAVSAS